MIKRFKQTQKFRVIIGDVSFYTTARQIRDGVGALGPCNAALQKALDVLEYTKNTKSGTVAACGIAGIWEGLNVQLDIV